MAIGIAAGAGAAQLGIGYGLGIIAWQPVDASATTWVNSLAWVTWVAASSTVFGALFADRLSSVSAPVAPGTETMGARAITIAWRIVIALAAAVGALITVPLVALPSRTPRPDNMVPYFTTGGYAVAGVIVGLVVAMGALTARAIAANVIASTAWLWTLAVVAVVDAVRAGSDVAGTAQLATWQFTDAVWVRGMVNLPGALLMLAISLVIGVLAAWPAGRRGDNRVGVAISGAAGPVLVAAAYFLAAPGLGERDQHLSSFVMAPYAVLAGLAGSVLVAAIGPKGAHTANKAARREAAEERTRRSAAEYTEWAHALAAAEKADVSAPKAGMYDDVPDDADSTGDLHDDGYAPSRAYGDEPSSRAFGDEPSSREYMENPSAREYAADTVEPEPVTTSASSASSGSSGSGSSGSGATGRAAVKEPLWPTQPGSPTTEPKPARTSRFRKGKSSD